MAFGRFDFTLVCMLLGFFFSKTFGKCPPESLIRPCSCTGSSLSCSGITDQSVLEGVFQKLGNNHISKFVLRNSKVENLIASSLEKNFIERIHVEDSVLDNLFDRLPPYENQLYEVSVKNVTIQNDYHMENLQPLTELEYLFITSTLYPKIGIEFNMYVSEKIRRVHLFLTKTESIDYAFVGKSELESVRVQNASLTSINRVTFPYPAQKLQVLTFEGNQIEKLDQDQFTFMSGLRVVSFAGNKIETVSEEVFGEIYAQLKFLDFSGNPINCDCSMQWIAAKDNTGKIVLGKCEAPPSVAGKDIVDLKPSDFTSCPNKSS